MSAKLGFGKDIRGLRICQMERLKITESRAVSRCASLLGR